jgi:hypothetical protein
LFAVNVGATATPFALVATEANEELLNLPRAPDVGAENDTNTPGTALWY